MYLTAPVKDASGASAQLVVGGLTADCLRRARTLRELPAGHHAHMTRHIAAPASGEGPVMETQDWVFRTATGEHLEMHIEFSEVARTTARIDERAMFLDSAKDAGMVRVSHEQLVLDILRNTTTNPPDHVTAFSFSGGGGSYARLFDGTEKTLSWDSILWMNRTESGR